MVRVLVSIVAISLLGLSAAWAADYEMVSRIDRVEKDRIVLPDGLSLDLVNKDSPLSTRSRVGFVTQCFTDRHLKIECKMLADVGYVDRAKILISGGVVKTLQVIELAQ